MRPTEILGYEPGNILVEHEGRASELAMALSVRFCYEFELRRRLLDGFHGERGSPKTLTDIAAQAIALENRFKDYLVQPQQRRAIYTSIVTEIARDIIDDTLSDHPQLAQFTDTNSLAQVYAGLTKTESAPIDIAVHNRFSKILTLSYTFAQSRGAHTSDVFIHEHHYSELVRDAIHPDDFYIPFELKDKFNSASYWKSILIQIVMNLVSKDPEASPEGIVDMREILEQDSRLDHDARVFVLKQRRAELLCVRFMIERFWGNEGALMLTPDRRDRLLSVEGPEEI